MDTTALLNLLGALVALVPAVAVAAPLVEALVELGRALNWIPDGYAGLAQRGLNTAFFLVLLVAGETGNAGDAESALALASELAPTLLAIVLAIVSTKGVHELHKRAGAGADKRLAP